MILLLVNNIRNPQKLKAIEVSNHEICKKIHCNHLGLFHEHPDFKNQTIYSIPAIKR